MAESKTARASMRAGQGMPKKQDPFEAPEAKIKELRNLRANHLFVNRMDFVDALIAENDRLSLLTQAALDAANATNIVIAKENADLLAAAASNQEVIVRLEAELLEARTALDAFQRLVLQGRGEGDFNG
jgi:hypothetical protein